MNNKLLLSNVFAKHRRLLAIILFLTLLSLIAIIPVPYYSISPGEHLDVTSLIEVPPGHNHRINNRILMVTVNITHLRLGLVPFALLDQKTSIVSAKHILGITAPSSLKNQELQQMQSSKLDAKVAAFKYLGYKVPETGSGALVLEVVANSSAKTSHLQPGDVITSYQGKRIYYAQQLTSRIQSTHPYQIIDLGIETPKHKLNYIKVRLGQQPSHKGSAFLGVAITTLNKQFKFPFPIHIRTSSIGGPSAGLAFTLGIIDKLGLIKLAVGKTIAATGTITPNGQVGSIGGIEQKTFSINASKSSLFLVPVDNYKTSRSHARSGLKVVSVSNLNQAMKALKLSKASPGPLHRTKAK